MAELTWPETLIQRSKRKHEFAVQQWSLYTAYYTSGDGAEACVALYRITPEFDGDVVQSGRIRMP
jgi:hypothetical protein